MKYRPRHILEYVLLRSMTGLASILPYRVMLGIAWCFARAGFFVAGSTIREAGRRMKSVVGEQKSDREIRRDVWISWRNLFFNAVELMRTPCLTEQLLWQMAACDMREDLKARSEKKEGYIIAMCHTGNWDLAGIGMSLYGLPIFAMMRRLRNPLVDRYLNDMRTRFGMGVVERHSRALASVVRRLQAGEVLAILPDLRARTPSKALNIRFLGHDAWLAGGMALFAYKANVPIIPAFALRKGWTKHEWFVAEPVYCDPAADKNSEVRRVTQEVMDHFTDFVLKHPEQYFWFNARWVLEPFQAPRPPSSVI